MKNNKGITLIALVITIIVLLILAGVSIAMLTGNNGILTQANNSKYSTAKAEAVERINLALNAVKTEVYAQRVSAANWNPVNGTALQKQITDILEKDTIELANTTTTENEGKIVYSFDSSSKILTLSYYSVPAANLEEKDAITGAINLNTTATGSGTEPNSFLEIKSAVLPGSEDESGD